MNIIIYEYSLFAMIVLFIILFRILFYTPHNLGDFIISLCAADINLSYLDKDNNLRMYNFNHKDYDGDRASIFIKDDLSKYTINNQIEVYNIDKPHCKINSKRIKDYTQFTSCISRLTHSMIKSQKRKINIAIVVSVRNIKDKYKKGNFLKLANYSVNEDDTIEDICHKHTMSILITKKYNQLWNGITLEDIYHTMNVDYIFNNWRKLTTIKTKSGILNRINTNPISEKDIIDLIQIPSRAMIFFDYKDSYYISGVSKF